LKHVHREIGLWIETTMTNRPVDVVCVASWNVDLVSHVAQPLKRGETRMASLFSSSPGGKGSNAAVAAARQGATVGLIARIGDDDFGRMGRALWDREGIDHRYVVQARGERSGVAQILVYDDGDNSIAVAPGAGLGLGPEQVTAAQSMLEQCKVVMASLEVPSAATRAAFEVARRTGATTLLNPAPAQAIDAGLWALVDVLTPNETELQTLSGLPAGARLQEAAQRLLNRGVRAVVVTLGDRGCALFQAHKDEVFWPGLPQKVADTIGAGDTFTGALAAALARGEPLESAIRWANAAAALSVTQATALGGMPGLQATQDVLKPC
jgi:ribokinase